MEMTVIVVLGLVMLGLKAVQFGATVLADIVATAIANIYYWRRERITRALLAARPCAGTDSMVLWTATRTQRRLMAKSLKLSIAMTAHFSLFPASCLRGYAIARVLLAKA